MVGKKKAPRVKTPTNSKEIRAKVEARNSPEKEAEMVEGPETTAESLSSFEQKALEFYRKDPGFLERIQSVARAEKRKGYESRLAEIKDQVSEFLKMAKEIQEDTDSMDLNELFGHEPTTQAPTKRAANKPATAPKASRAASGTGPTDEAIAGAVKELKASKSNPVTAQQIANQLGIDWTPTLMKSAFTSGAVQKVGAGRGTKYY